MSRPLIGPEPMLKTGNLARQRHQIVRLVRRDPRPGHSGHQVQRGDHRGDACDPAAAELAEIGVCPQADHSYRNPRIEDRVQDIDEHVDDDVHERDEQDEALSHGEVALEDAASQHASDAGVSEDRLGQHRTRKEAAQLEAHDGDDGDGGIA